MKSKVYFIGVKNSEDPRVIKDKVSLLTGKLNLDSFIRQLDKVAIKMHFGEEGNTGHVRPEYVSAICDAVKRRGAVPFLSDTNTLYRGRRTNSSEHLKLAYEHGFGEDALGVQIVIPDDTKRENVSEVRIEQKFIKTAKIAKIFLQADAIIAVSHFKGHIMTGFAGSLKNIGMGCAIREGKLAQHSDVSPFVYTDKCSGCQACAKVCPAGAISVNESKAFIDGARCIGCASCIAACLNYAIEIKWEQGGINMQEKMVEHAKAVLDQKRNKAAFFNFAIKITKECDCLAKDDPRIASDVGILASLDPVSIDKASLDLVVKASGKDVFKEAHPQRDGLRQLNYAHELGLGNLDYELIEAG